MSTFPNRIDVHHHFFPPTFVRAMATKGLTDVAGTPLPSGWTPEHSLAVMERHDIATAFLSLPAPLTPLGGRDEVRGLARSSNE